MTDEAITTRIRQLMAQLFELDIEQLPENPQIGDPPGWDSLVHLQLIMSVEAEFGVRFRTERIPQLTSLVELAREVALG